MIAYARSRQGDAVGARAMAASVVEQLEALGHPEFAMLHEPDIWPALVRLLEGNSASMVVITLLGGFGIEIDGRMSPCPPVAQPRWSRCWHSPAVRSPLMN